MVTTGYAITQQAFSFLPSNFFSLVEGLGVTDKISSGCGFGRLGFSIFPVTFDLLSDLTPSASTSCPSSIGKGCDLCNFPMPSVCRVHSSVLNSFSFRTARLEYLSSLFRSVARSFSFSFSVSWTRSTSIHVSPSSFRGWRWELTRVLIEGDAGEDAEERIDEVLSASREGRYIQ